MSTTPKGMNDRELKVYVMTQLGIAKDKTIEELVDEAVAATIEHTMTLTPRQVAIVLDVSGGTARRWLHEGRLRGVRVGGRYRIRLSDLADFVASAA